MKKIPLTQGKFAIVDDADFDWINQWKWQATRSGRTFYAVRSHIINGKKTRHTMHSEIIGDAPAGCVIDHKNGNGIDNRRENLRICTYSQNSINSIRYNNKTGYRGVCQNKDGGRFGAYISINKSVKYIGSFDTIKMAAAAYNIMAKKYHGEYAKLNDIDIELTEDQLIKLTILRPDNKSGFRGVSRRRQKWRCSIGLNGDIIQIGIFDTPEEAARAYDSKARELLGDKAKLNFPDE